MKPSDTTKTPFAKEGLFRPGQNCWHTANAARASLLIDCANYYRALHHALSRARHSIFILGWDIDSRIVLLRGKENKSGGKPVTLFDVIHKKAEENPDIKIYLNKWDYSLFFIKEREPFSGFKWELRTPDNVYFCADYKIPFGASHHQKIIVVDDEIAFCGGMDIALGRWDERQHHINTQEREDPGGFFKPFGSNRYGPYHDIQIMVTGPVVNMFSGLARERWKKAAKFEPVPLRKDAKAQTALWPANVEPDFNNVSVSVARTIPKSFDSPAIREVQTMYVNEISRAEKFIYIENQYLTCQTIAAALRDRLQEKPDLRVLIVSSDTPGGFMERKAMWSGRIDFCKMVGENITGERFAVTYPVSKEDGGQKTIHIHSKIMIVDDRYLHVGSANLNNRSMGFDTECDLIIEGQEEETRQSIAAIRNNLIREHTGREEDDIHNMIESQISLDRLLEYQDYSRQHLLKIDDTPYKNQWFAGLAQKLGDPKEAHFPVNVPVKRVLGIGFAIAFLAWILLAWWQPDFSALFSRAHILEFIESARGSEWSILWVIGIYLLAGLVFFPVTVLNLSTAMVFGPIYGLFLAMLGSLASAALGYGIGYFTGSKTLHLFKVTRGKIQDYAERGGVLGMTLLRFVPIAPYTLVNLAFGLTGIAFIPYMTATFFGLLPGVFAKAMFGGALGQLWEDPRPGVIFFTLGSLALWFLIVWGTHRLFQYYKDKLEI